MDDARFDTLARSLSTPRSRRSLPRLLGGLGLGGVLSARTAQEAVAALRKGGARCDKGRECKTGKCLSNGTCSCSAKYPVCKQPKNPCKKATCNFATKSCETGNTEDGISCLWGGMECFGGSCGCPEYHNVCQQCTRCGPEGSCLPDPDRQGKACQQTDGICCQTVCCEKACNQAGQCPGFG